MKKLALCLLISFSCALQAMEEKNQNFKYVICCVNDAPRTWHEISRKMITFEFEEGLKERLEASRTRIIDRHPEGPIKLDLKLILAEDPPSKIISKDEMIGIYKVFTKDPIHEFMRKKCLSIVTTRSMPPFAFGSEVAQQFHQMFKDAKEAEENLDNSRLFNDID